MRVFYPLHFSGRGREGRPDNMRGPKDALLKTVVTLDLLRRPARLHTSCTDLCLGGYHVESDYTASSIVYVGLMWYDV